MITKNVKEGYIPAYLTKATKLVSIDINVLGTAWNTWAASQGCQVSQGTCCMTVVICQTTSVI